MRQILTVAAIAALVALLAAGVYQLVKDGGKPKRRQVQQISLVKPPLPPKPPPEPERPKEVVKNEIKTPEPEQPKDDAPAPQPDLGLDAKGVAGGDSFGLAGRPGGRDITTLGGLGGTGTGRGNSAFYANQLENELQDLISRNESLRGANYRTRVRLWINQEGAVVRAELAASTGDAELDRRLRAALGEIKRMRPPPEGLPQPALLELVART